MREPKTPNEPSTERTLPNCHGAVSATLESASPIYGDARVEVILSAKLISPTTIEVEFPDRRRYLPISSLDLPLNQFLWSTVKATATGESITIEDTNGEPIPVDAATVRYLSDENYARDLNDELRALHIPKTDLQKSLPLNQPPDVWMHHDDSGLIR